MLVSITQIAADISKTFAMIRTCNAGGACNVVWDINRYFTVHYFVHDSESRDFAPQD